MTFIVSRLFVVSFVFICITGCDNSASEIETSGIVGFDTKEHKQFEFENGRYMVMVWLDEYKNGRVEKGPMIVYGVGVEAEGIAKLGNNQGFKIASLDEVRQPFIVQDGVYLSENDQEPIRIGDDWPAEMIEDKELRKQFWKEQIFPKLKKQQAEQK